MDREMEDLIYQINLNGIHTMHRTARLRLAPGPRGRTTPEGPGSTAA